jgi:hypothetical protein
MRGAPKILASEPMLETGGYGVVLVRGLEHGMLSGLDTMGGTPGRAEAW